MLVDVCGTPEAASILFRDRFLFVEANVRKAVYLRTYRDDVIILLEQKLTPFSLSAGKNWKLLRQQVNEKLAAEFNGSSIVFENGLTLNLHINQSKNQVEFAGAIDWSKLRYTYNCYQTLSTAFELPDFIREAVECVRTACLSCVLKACGEIVGIGAGYTPEGDDFVSGILLALKLLNIKVDLQPIIFRAVERSRWPSWKIIEHASHGCTYMPIYRLCMSLPTAQDPIEHLVDAVRIGATTGFATVTGLLETLVAFHSILSKSSLTSCSSSTGGDQATSTTSNP
ncbi:MAG: DUF2877 domain-containing protein [Candidatus Caldarchaeum sp.]